jgi:CheY-like chemotaxis protein
MGKVLVVDDQKDIGDLYKTIIDSVGHNCTVTYGGKEALEQIKKNKFSLILLDISMPDMDGIELIKKIKTEQNASDAKIVFITASMPHDQDVNTLKELGAKTVLMKPIKKKEMIEMIAQYIN